MSDRNFRLSITLLLIVCAIILSGIELLVLVIWRNSIFLSLIITSANFIVGILLLFLYFFKVKAHVIFANKLFALNDRTITPLLTGLSEILNGNLEIQLPLSALPRPSQIRNDNSTIDEAYNVLTESLNRTVIAFNAITNIPCKRLCFTGADDYQSGQLGARLLGEAIQGRGTVAIIAVGSSAMYSTFREEGFLNVLLQDFPQVKLVRTILTERDNERTANGLRSLFQDFPNISGLYQLDEATILTTLNIITQIRKPGSFKFVCHGKRAEFSDYFSKGVITASITQAPYLQGYNPLIHAYNNIVALWKPLSPKFLITPKVVTQENYRNEIGISIENEGLAQIVNDPSPRPMTFAYLIPKRSDFWPPVYDGAESAKMVLAKRNVDIKIIQPCPESNAYDTEKWISLIEKLVSQGISAIAVPIFNNALIPTINTAVDRGVVIVTYNQEPSSLREMISLVSKQSASVIKAGYSLSHGVEESTKAINNVRDSLLVMQENITEESDNIVIIEKVLKSFLDLIDMFTKDFGEISEWARIILEEVEKGGNSMLESKKATYQVKDSTERSHSLMQQLGESSKEIGSIAGFIEEITNRTNILAVNASILSARAGSQGKGFSVISSEIRDLAAQSAQAAEKISKIIRAIQDSIIQVAQRTEEEMGQVLTSVNQTNITEEALNHIKTLARENVKKTESAISLLGKMATESPVARDSISTLIQKSGHISGEIAQISAAAEEVTAGSSSIGRTAESLVEMAKAQEILLSAFRSGKTRDDSTGNA